MKNKYSIFLGYQFKSNYFNKSELDSIVSFSVDSAQSDLSKSTDITIDFSPIDVTLGKILHEEIQYEIKKSDICIFEISDLNNNVFYEIGLAQGFGKPVILLISDSSLSKNTIPSDFQGVVYLNYSNLNNLKAKLGNHILSLCSESIILDNKDNFSNLLKSLWLGGSNKVVFITGEIRNTRGQNEINGFINYVRNGDAKALLDSVINVLKLDNTSDFQITSSDMVSAESLSGNIISIGGPKANKITKNFIDRHQVPWVYKYKSGDDYKKKSIYNNSTKKELISILDKNDVLVDYGMILVSPNPLNPRNNCILLTGLYTFGVLGCVKAISLTSESSVVLNNINLLSKLNVSKNKILQIIVETNIVNGKVITPILNESLIEIIDL